ncbi:hypothetical protein ACFQJC_03970 [Haloferax namakaokahaiae]|uniref:Uncharacterized protein n=1 Tax=Haloferax namakaokahaiae TaxID=1748331 RepID=A0ABD5ZCN7_9EURY
MSLYESIHEFVGEHETLLSVGQYDQKTVILTETRLVELEHPTGHSAPDAVRSVRSIHLSRPSIIGYSVELADEQTTISFHNDSGAAVESVTLPMCDHRFAVVFSTTVGSRDVLSPSA